MSRATRTMGPFFPALLVFLFMVQMMVLAAMAYKIELLQKEVNEWRQAAAPVFESRGRAQLVAEARPKDLADFLNPCHAVDFRERGKWFQDGCGLYGQPYKTVQVAVGFVKPSK